MNVWLLYGVAMDSPLNGTLLRVCDSEDAALAWAQVYLNTSQWTSIFTQCWVTSGMPEKQN